MAAETNLNPFVVRLRIARIERPNDTVEFTAEYDPASIYSWLNRDKVRTLSVQALQRRVFRLHGKIVERDIVALRVSVDEYSGCAIFVVAESGEKERVGEHTLSAMSLAADLENRRLVEKIWLALAAAS